MAYDKFKEFLSSVKTLMDNNQWEEVYNELREFGLKGTELPKVKEFNNGQSGTILDKIPIFTGILLKLGINPMPYFKYGTPLNYAWLLDLPQLHTIVVPDGVEYIAAGFVDGCPSVRKIVLPKTIGKIGYKVFCENKNLNIYYNGTFEDWKNINLSGGYITDCNGLLICKDKEITLEKLEDLDI